MGKLCLAEVKTSISESKIWKIVFRWSVDIFLAFDVISDRLFNKKGILKEIKINLNGIFRQVALLDGIETVCYFWGIGEATNVGSDEIDEFFQVIVFLDIIALLYFFDIGMGEKILQIFYFLLCVSHCDHLRESTICHVFQEKCFTISLFDRSEFLET